MKSKPQFIGSHNEDRGRDRETETKNEREKRYKNELQRVRDVTCVDADMTKNL